MKWRSGSRAVFRDPDRGIDDAAHHLHARMARDAAREAVGTIHLTARRQYRRYRATHPDQYLSYDSWLKHYKEITDGPTRWPDPPSDGMQHVPGGTFTP